jgi:hypothetical protein
MRTTRVAPVLDQPSRMLLCGKCGHKAGVVGFVWSRTDGPRCRWCGDVTYVIALTGPSPYRVWPLDEAPLTDREVLGLFGLSEDHGMLFLTPEDLRTYERIRGNGRRWW